MSQDQTTKEPIREWSNAKKPTSTGKHITIDGKLVELPSDLNWVLAQVSNQFRLEPKLEDHLYFRTPSGELRELPLAKYDLCPCPRCYEKLSTLMVALAKAGAPMIALSMDCFGVKREGLRPEEFPQVLAHLVNHTLDQHPKVRQILSCLYQTESLQLTAVCMVDESRQAREWTFHSSETIAQEGRFHHLYERSQTQEIKPWMVEMLRDQLFS